MTRKQGRGDSWCVPNLANSLTGKHALLAEFNAIDHLGNLAFLAMGQSYLENPFSPIF